MAEPRGTRAKHVTKPLLATVLVGGLALVTFFAFDAWLAHGADIFLAMSASGLSWCL